jgi:pimeloyl-ACP methyl ester carboxylesterase
VDSNEEGRGQKAESITPGRLLLIYGVAILVIFVVIPAGLYVAVDPERLDLDQSVRGAAAGQFVQLSDGFTHYELGGPPTGRLVVLAAGATVPYYIWDPTFAALVKAGFRVLRYDYYGRGYSDRPDIPFTQELYVRQFAELVDALHITQPFDLMGLSFGGSVITSVAARYPGRVRSLVYFDPAFRMPETMSAIERMPRVWNVITAILDERSWADGQLNDFLHPERFPDWPSRYRVQLQYRGFRLSRLSDAVNNAAADQRDELQQVGNDPRPVLVVWGKQDPNVPFELSASLLGVMPMARLVAVEDAGHLPQWEQPAIVHRALIEFLHEVQP